MNFRIACKSNKICETDRLLLLLSSFSILIRQNETVCLKCQSSIIYKIKVLFLAVLIFKSKQPFKLNNVRSIKYQGLCFLL